MRADCGMRRERAWIWWRDQALLFDAKECSHRRTGSEGVTLSEDKETEMDERQYEGRREI